MRPMAAPLDIEKIARLTLTHYNQRADEFRDGTRDHDVSQNINALLRHIGGAPPFTILDFGCGPGRDLKVFAGLGHRVIGRAGRRNRFLSGPPARPQRDRERPERAAPASSRRGAR